MLPNLPILHHKWYFSTKWSKIWKKSKWQFSSQLNSKGGYTFAFFTKIAIFKQFWKNGSRVAFTDPTRALFRAVSLKLFDLESKLKKHFKALFILHKKDIGDGWQKKWKFLCKTAKTKFCPKIQDGHRY